MARKIRMQDFAHFTQVPPRSRRSIVSKAYRASLVEYPLQGDYYKQVRESMVRLHKRGEPIETLSEVIAKVHPNRRPHVTRVVKAYIAWCKGKGLSHFTARKGYWNEQGVEVRVNPELGLVIDGRPHLIKVNFTKFPVPQSEAKIMMHLMHRVLAPQAPEGCVMAVLDLATGKMHRSPRPSATLDLFLERHAAEVRRTWEEVEAPDAA